jgi:hypothetical protein
LVFFFFLISWISLIARAAKDRVGFIAWQREFISIAFTSAVRMFEVPVGKLSVRSYGKLEPSTQVRAFHKRVRNLPHTSSFFFFFLGHLSTVALMLWFHLNHSVFPGRSREARSLFDSRDEFG